MSYIGFKSCDKIQSTPRVAADTEAAGRWLWEGVSVGGHTSPGAVLLLFHHSIAAVFSGLSALFCGVLYTWFLLLLMGTQF